MSSGFVTETELAEARQKRQEEWEKVRQPDEPLGKSTIDFLPLFFSIQLNGVAFQKNLNRN